jgi:hypothetical protein
MSKWLRKDLIQAGAGCILALGGVCLVLLFIVLPHYEVDVPTWVIIIALVVVAAAGFLDGIMMFPLAWWRRLTGQPESDAGDEKAGPGDGSSARKG